MYETPYSKFNGPQKRREIEKVFGWSDMYDEIHAMYTLNKMSGIEIAEFINEKMDPLFHIAPRSIQRAMKKFNAIRSVGDAYRLAAEKGRVKWAYKMIKNKPRQLPVKLRMEILKRDKYKCVLCGATPQTSVLEVDHIIAKCNNGTDEEENLRTLCHECNIGKRIAENER